MADAPLFGAQILSRPSPRAIARRAILALGVAATLHVAGAILFAIIPILSVALMKPPVASMRITILPPRPPGPGHESKPAGRIRKGSGAAETRARARAPLPPPEPSSAALPTLPPPDTAIVADAPASEADGPPGGAPDGTGTSSTGAIDGDPEGSGPGGGGAGWIPGLPSEHDPGVTRRPVLIEESYVLPRYPDVARRARVRGEVILIVVIRADGTVGEIETLRSADARFGFDLAAIEAVRRWRYRPALMHGREISVQAVVHVEFTLAD